MWVFYPHITTDVLESTVDNKLFTGNDPELRLTWHQLFLLLFLVILIVPLCILILCNFLWCLKFWQLVWIHFLMNKKYIYHSALLFHFLLIFNLKNSCGKFPFSSLVSSNTIGWFSPCLRRGLAGLSFPQKLLCSVGFTHTSHLQYIQMLIITPRMTWRFTNLNHLLDILGLLFFLVCYTFK